VSGTEEDLTQDLVNGEEDDAELVKLMEEKFEASGLERRDDFDEDADQKTEDAVEETKEEGKEQTPEADEPKADDPAADEEG